MKKEFAKVHSMKINIVSIVFLLIKGISCLKNGLPVKPGYTNFVATIWEYDLSDPQYLCSGTIISDSHVLTAGHCVHNFGRDQIYVIAGRVDEGDTISVMVNNVYLHYNFRKVYNPSKTFTEYWLNDLAILKTQKIIWRKNIIPLSLDRRQWMNITCETCYIMGWNYDPTNVGAPMSLQWAPALILGIEKRGRMETFLLPNEIYAFLTIGPAIVDDTDIGNSLLCPDLAVGIVVGGRDRTHSVMTVLTLAPYKDFIDYIIHEGVNQIGEGEFHNVVSIWKSGRFRCGGFMIDSYHIVTAAHCVNDSKINSVVVASGNFFEQSSVEHITVKLDIAVLKLSSGFQWNSSIHLIDISDLSSIFSQTPCQILRWIDPPPTNSALKILMKSPVKIFNSEKIKGADSDLESELFHAESFHSLPIASNADIGNPVIHENNIIGMVIRVDLNASATTPPVTCLKIFSYRDFIESVINKA